MADNVVVGGVNYSTDDVTTLNGAVIAAGTAQTQRIKIQYGDDNTARDVSQAFPLPIIGTVDTRGTAIAATSGNIAAAGTGTVGPFDVSRAGNVTFVAKNTVAASAWAGAPVLVFEQSDDNTSWSPLMVLRNDSGLIASTHILGANAASAEMLFEAGLEAVSWVRCRVTTGPTTNGMTIVISAGGLPFSPFVSVTQQRPTFPTGAVLQGYGNTIRVTGTALAASTALVAAPGAGLSIYVTDIVASNSGATLTVIGLLPLGGVNVFDLPVAASGGGGTINLQTPWKLAAATGLNYVVSAATTSWFLTVSYYVAA